MASFMYKVPTPNISFTELTTLLRHQSPLVFPLLREWAKILITNQIYFIAKLKRDAKKTHRKIGWIRIRIKVISWIPIRIRINLKMTSHNVWNTSLSEHFSRVSSLYLEARIRIRIKVKGTVKAGNFVTFLHFSIFFLKILLGNPKIFPVGN